MFRTNLARATLELKRGVERVIDFFHEHDEGPDVVIAQPGARIVALELFDKPSRVINSDVKAVIGAAEKGTGELTQFACRFPGQDRQLCAALPIDQAIFEIDPNLGVSSLEQALDLAEERFVHKMSDAAASSSRLSN